MVKLRKDGELRVEYSVDLDNYENLCSCGYFGYMKRPCSHSYADFRSVNKLSLLKPSCDLSWTKEVYQRAYDPLVNIIACVMTDELTRFEKLRPLAVPKKRGWTKKSKQIYPQIATESLEEAHQQMHYMR